MACLGPLLLWKMDKICGINHLKWTMHNFFPDVVAYYSLVVKVVNWLMFEATDIYDLGSIHTKALFLFFP